MRRSILLTATVGMLVAGVSLASCATQSQNSTRDLPGAAAESDQPAPVPLPTDPGPYRASGTVLESPEHGPMLCMFVATSYPPQCGNLELVGWDWDLVDDEESANGTTWGGSYEVIGTWDGERLTLTEPPRPAVSEAMPTPEADTPCPEPAGGWTVLDPAKTTSQTLDAVINAARSRPDFAGVWLDQPIREPRSENAPDNDPTNLIVNVRVTGDVAQAEQDLRRIWGGALCVSAGARSLAELETIQSEISAHGTAIKLLYSGINETAGIITVGVVLDDGRLQDYYDERYGAGVVTVTSWLQPV
jgi:hypothetical protein